MSTSKHNLRKIVQNKRALLTTLEQKQKSISIIENVANSAVFKAAKHIAIYHAVGGEANPENLKSHVKHFYLPVLPDTRDLGLFFAPITDLTQYKNNKFSIPEPVCSKNEYISPESLDLVVMPLLGFDLKGNRLGMGGGYYDRCFSFKKSNSLKPLLLGFAYDFQEVDEIETEPWDIGFDLIATETRLIDTSTHGT